MFTFPSEAQMLLHIKLWEEHFPALFEKLKEKGCTAYSYNQVWNSPGTFKTSIMSYNVFGSFASTLRFKNPTASTVPSA